MLNLWRKMVFKLRKRQRVSLSRTITWVVGIYYIVTGLIIFIQLPSFYNFILTEIKTQQLQVYSASSMSVQWELFLFIKNVLFQFMSAGKGWFTNIWITNSHSNPLLSPCHPNTSLSLPKLQMLPLWEQLRYQKT